MRGLFAAFARNRVFANVLLMIILLAGVMAAVFLVRESFPAFELDIITVSVVWPGADPQEVEEGIILRIEEAIDGIEGIKEYNATASENLGMVLIEVQENYDADYVKDRVRNEVEAISTFPEDAEKPVTEQIVFRESVLMIALSGPDMPERTLKEWAEDIKEELRALPEISQVQVQGVREYEISVEVSEERLREYGLSFEQVADAIRRSSLNLAGGTMRSEGEEVRLRTIGRKYTGEELSKIVVRARPSGEVITLGRIATIRDTFEEDRVMSRFNGEPAVMVAVLKINEEDALAIDSAVQEYLEEKRSELPEGVSMNLWARTADFLQARIDLLVSNGIIGLVLVFILLWLFLDLRLSFWAGMGIPISLSGGLALMWATGETLNMISLFGLIMVLGILVDDAIIVGEAIYVARRNGHGPLKAAIEGVSEVGMPVIAAVTTTVVAFIPLLYVGGIMGKFIRILPAVVIACLLMSLIECLILLPAHLNHLPDPNRPVKGHHPLKRFGNRLHHFTNRGLERFVERVYTPFIDWVLHYRYVTFAAAIGILLITIGIFQSGVVKFVFFPEIDGDIITATVEFPNGTPLDVTGEAVQRLEAAMREIAAETETSSGDPLIENMYSITGSTISDEQPIRGSHVGSVRVELLETADRGISSQDLMRTWEDVAAPLPGAVALTMGGMEAGPPGAAIEFWVQGREMEQILAAAEDLKAKLGTFEGAYQIQHDYRPGKNEFQLTLKPQARALGLTTSDLARQVYAGYFGEEAIRLQRGRDDVRVRVRYTEEERRRISDLDRVRIRTPQGHEVPLYSVADVDYGPGYATINRTDGMRRVSVTSEVSATANAQDIMTSLEEEYLSELEERFPGVQVSVQGESQDTQESFSTLKVGYPMALVAIFVIVATIFRSYVQPLVIMITIPFGIIGAIIAHIVMGYDLSIMSMFGIVALSGVVVNDAIVLIERVNEYLAEGFSFHDSLVKGGARRFRAIFLTTLSTVGGLMPLILERDLQARFLIPMALAIAGGVVFATLLTLVLIPCLLKILNDLRRLAFYFRRGYMPSAESVEPATSRGDDEEEEAEGGDAGAGSMGAQEPAST